jgi:hypothetical protein
VKASVPKLFFCPGSASYTPVTQGSRWRVASRQLRKPTTPSALAFFVVVRAPSGFPFGCAVQNPITPLTPTLPTRPPLPKNTGPQTLLPPGNGSLLPNPKAFQTRKIRAQPAASARPRHFTGGKRRTTEARDADAGGGAAAIQREDLGSSGHCKAFQRQKQRCLSALLSTRGAWVEHLNAVYCALLFMGHESRKSVAFQYPFVGGCAGP